MFDIGPWEIVVGLFVLLVVVAAVTNAVRFVTGGARRRLDQRRIREVTMGQQPPTSPSR